jgi:hypothetical protein
LQKAISGGTRAKDNFSAAKNSPAKAQIRRKNEQKVQLIKLQYNITKYIF